MFTRVPSKLIKFSAILKNISIKRNVNGYTVFSKYKKNNSICRILIGKKLNHLNFLSKNISTFNLGKETGEYFSVHRSSTNYHFSRNFSNTGPDISSRKNYTDPIENIIFDMFKDKDGKLSTSKFLQSIFETGIRKTDPRIQEMMSNLRQLKGDSSFLDKDTFKRIVKDNIVLVGRAIRKQFVVPDFKDLTQCIEKFYWNCKANTGGKVASYIPQLSKFDPNLWAVSICTVDGQRFSIGDTDVLFTIQSSGKPINYAIALNELGSDIVHQYVGQEPSGRMFNELVLDHNHKPHNPMVNAGAIVTCALLLDLIEPEMKVAEKFDWICQYYKAFAGGEYLGFNNATFLSEREAADRNYAIGYFMKENKCYPPNSNLKETLDFYFQLCSLEVSCETQAVMAATLANGGICPTTGQQVIDTLAVRDVLSLMHSCGMYDYSGQFAFKVGIPAKSGVSGCTMVVVPNVMGLCLWSPPLDSYGNSVRAVQFCDELIELFNFHQYDNLRHTLQKKDPRRQKFEGKSNTIVTLLFSACSGDLSSLRRQFLSGINMNMPDYDGRTALHLAASEGHLNCVKFLLEVCGVDHTPRDRWGHTPFEEAQAFNQKEVADFIENWATEKAKKGDTTTPPVSDDSTINPTPPTN